MVVFINAETGSSVSPELPEGYKEFTAEVKTSITDQSVPIMSSQQYNSTIVRAGSGKVTVVVNVGVSPEEELIRDLNEKISGETVNTMVNTTYPFK